MINIHEGDYVSHIPSSCSIVQIMEKEEEEVSILLVTMVIIWLAFSLLQLSSFCILNGAVESIQGDAALSKIFF